MRNKECNIDFFVPGIEMTAEMPSKMQMIRMATNLEFRTAAQRLVTEMKNAGVDLSSAVCISYLASNAELMRPRFAGGYAGDNEYTQRGLWRR
jgi:hypothetical protein